MSAADANHLFVGLGAVAVSYADSLQHADGKLGVYLRPKHAQALHDAGYAVSVYHLNSALWKRVLLSTLPSIGMGLFLGFELRLAIWLCVLITIGFFLVLWIAEVIPRTYAPPQNTLQIEPEHVFTDAKSVSKHSAQVDWNYLWLCLSGEHLRAGDGLWLQELLAAMDSTGRPTTVMLLSPGVEDKEFLLSLYPHPSRIVVGLIACVSYQSPLFGARFHATPVSQPGVAVFYPPGEANTFYRASIEDEKVNNGQLQAVLSSMSKHGCPSTLSTSDPNQDKAALKVVLQCLVMGLECKDWSFQRLCTDSHMLGLVAKATQEAAAIECRRNQTTVPVLFRALYGATLCRLVLVITPHVMPMDFQVYMKYHFSKGIMLQQTTGLMTAVATCAPALPLPSENLTMLLDLVKTKRTSNRLEQH